MCEFRHAPLTVGAAIQNVGPQMKYLEDGYNLPLTLAVGTEYSITKMLLLSADLKNQPYDAKTTVNFGSEFMPVSILTLRVGYLANSAQAANASSNKFTEENANLSGFGFGLGLRIFRGILDYSFSPSGDLGSAQRISLSVKF